MDSLPLFRTQHRKKRTLLLHRKRRYFIHEQLLILLQDLAMTETAASRNKPEFGRETPGAGFSRGGRRLRDNI